MLLSIIFSTTFRAEYTLWSTLLDCSKNVLSNINAAFACFTETRGTGSDNSSSKSSTSAVPRTESVMSSSVRIPETATSSSISTKFSNVSYMILQQFFIRAHSPSVIVFSMIGINISSSSASSHTI